MRIRLILGPVLAGTATLFVAVWQGTEAHPKAPAPTFAADVAPIFFKSCVTCHRPGEVAPMSLLTYESARPWARSIKSRVMKREMPPWSADAARSLPLRNEQRLTDSEIETIVQWADAGAPQGNPTDTPRLPAIAGSGWRHPDGRPPDLVIEMPEFTVPAQGEVPMLNFYVKSPLAETRWLEAVQMMPGRREVVHHAAAFSGRVVKGTLPAGPVAGARGVDGEFQGSQGEAATSLITYTPGREFERFPPGVGKRIVGGADAYVSFNMHYQPTGKPERDRTRVALWFLKTPPEHELRQSINPKNTLANGREIVVDDQGRSGGGEIRLGRQLPTIPPHVDNWEAIAVEAFTSDVTILNFWPHAHLRGKSFRYVLVYPDGRELTLLTVPKYDFHWQFVYELRDPLKVPAGSKIVSYVTFDNSAGNRFNPAPDKEVHWSEQSWDEMLAPVVSFIYDHEPPREPNQTASGSTRPAPLDIVEVVGCQTGQPADISWTLTQAGASAVTKTQLTTTSEIKAASARSLGSGQFTLIGADIFKPSGRRGEKVVVKGVLIKEPQPRINVTSLQTLAATCQM
jgi:hypothetical protein